MCVVRRGAGSTGCIDAVSAPFEYPCLERGDIGVVSALQ